MEKQIELNNGHDWVTIRTVNDLVEIVFEGRDPTSVTIRLMELKDVRAIAAALVQAVAALA